MITMTKQIIWNASCISLATINLISLILWFYLKLSGETSSFCLYDSFYFLFFYLFCFFYSLAIIQYPNVTVINLNIIYFDFFQLKNCYPIGIQCQNILHAKISGHWICNIRIGSIGSFNKKIFLHYGIFDGR